MVSREALVRYIDELLDVPAFSDYAPNGLQVEGAESISRLVTGVTASRTLLEAAVTQRAEAVLVHHGYFWKGEDPRVVGMKQRRLKLLLEHNINLLAYHLPLDAHPELGNNACLGRQLQVEVKGGLGDEMPRGVGLWGTLAEPLSPAALAGRIEHALNRAPLHIPGGRESITTVGWCTGSAQGMIAQAAARGLDAFISGEISEPTVHAARELGIHYFAAGHHATERGGVCALGEHLATRFDIEHQFVDIDNPV
ncbi:MAG: Nif3-like dinuclear metal center hexameric protein [Gammaproteobacteria bacterium]